MNLENKYKFGISYNLFDGEELLEDSIIQIRKHVDYISVVYQKLSNWGQSSTKEQKVILDKLLKLKLIDEIFEYEVNLSVSPHANEINKRNIGLALSKKAECTHHMSMDCDEFYESVKFGNLIDWYIKNPNYAGFCELINYYKSSEYLILREDKTNVSLFFPITNDNKYSINATVPVLVDPTRKPDYNIQNVFNKDFIVMHHMTMVRKDMSLKLLNSSARFNYNNSNVINNIINHYNSFDDKLVGLGTQGYYELKKITPLFKLKNFNENINRISIL